MNEQRPKPPTPTELLRKVETRRVTGVLARASICIASNQNVLGWFSPWLAANSAVTKLPEPGAPAPPL